MSTGTADPDAPLTPDQQYEQLVDDHTPDGPILTEHALDRWVERVCCEYADVAPWDLPAAYERALPVGLPNSYERARLHAPTRSVIVFTRDHPGGPPVLVTILTTDMHAIEDDHLKTCERCGLRYRDGGDDECGWCPEATERRRWGVEHGH